MAGGIDLSKYAHSPAHKAIATKDYASLRKIISELPRLCDPIDIRTEAESLVEEEKADGISTIIGRRDNIPNRETPLHLAVKLSDETATEMLMVAGADWSLQNEQGWNALQEAICNGQKSIARTIVRHYQPLAWAKWCRRLPRLVATMRRVRDFYMEITFHFESSVIPFISRIAPSDTYKIWKRGANLRADMTLVGFDGFKIQRSDQSILFLGDGSEDGKAPPGSLYIVSHKDKEIINALDNAGSQACDAEVKHEIDMMSKTNIFRPSIDVTEAVLLPQLTWRHQEKIEMVGPWKAKVYEMHNVVVSIKSRRVPTAMTDDEFFSSSNENETENNELNEILIEKERKQLEDALKMGSFDRTSESSSDAFVAHHHSCNESKDIPIQEANECEDMETKNENKGWFGSWRKRDQKCEGEKKHTSSRSSTSGREKARDLANGSSSTTPIKPTRKPMDVKGNEQHGGMDNKTSSSRSTRSCSGSRHKDGNQENEYKKGLKPILWLSPDFPLRIEELIPLLDILANKVKAIRRLRELLTTKLPMGTFPVKVAIPVVPTIRVLVTFTKFEELAAEEFSTPPSSPTSASHIYESPTIDQSSSTSSSLWFRWIKAPYNHRSKTSTNDFNNKDIQDPFAIPLDYKWNTSEAKKREMEEKNKAKKGKNKDSSNRSSDQESSTS